jgi:hypothetical protein
MALLAQMELEPKDPLATASADIVTYLHDPREDPGQLAHPAAVVLAGTRLR